LISTILTWSCIVLVGEEMEVERQDQAEAEGEQVEAERQNQVEVKRQDQVLVQVLV